MKKIITLGLLCIFVMKRIATLESYIRKTISDIDIFQSPFEVTNDPGIMWNTIRNKNNTFGTQMHK